MRNENISKKFLLCIFQVECSPLCGIVWLKDGLAIDEDDERYTIEFGERAPNYAKNDFESVYSTLRFNIERWPGGKLDRIIDNANYTCQSKSWQMTSLESDGVSSTTYFRVECKQFCVSYKQNTSVIQLVVNAGAIEIHVLIQLQITSTTGSSSMGGNE